MSPQALLHTLVIVLLALSSSVRAAVQDALDYRNLVAMVHIQDERGVTSAYGAGIVVGQSKERTLIVTANHVVRTPEGHVADKVAVEFWERRGELFRATANAFYTNRELDLAVLVINHSAAGPVPMLPVELMHAISPSPPSALVGSPVQLLGFTGRRPWNAGPPSDTVTDGSALSFTVRSGSVAPGSSGGAVFDSFRRIVGLVTKIPPGGGRAHAVPIGIVLDQLSRWNLDVSLKPARAPSDTDSLATIALEKTQIEIQYHPEKERPREARTVGYTITVRLPPELEELKPEIRIAYGTNANTRTIRIQPPEYSAGVKFAPPMVLEGRLTMRLPDGRELGPVTRTLDFKSGPFNAVNGIENKFDRLRNSGGLTTAEKSWEWQERSAEKSRQRIEARNRESEEREYANGSKVLPSRLEKSYPHWRVTCRLVSEPALEQWTCNTVSLASQLTYEPFDLFVKDLVVQREVGAPEVAIPLQKKVWKTALSDGIAQLLKDGANAVYVIVRLRSGETFGPKQLCARADESSNVCK